MFNPGRPLHNFYQKRNKHTYSFKTKFIELFKINFRLARQSEQNYFEAINQVNINAGNWGKQLQLYLYIYILLYPFYIFTDSLTLLLMCGYLISALFCRHSDPGSYHRWDPFFADTFSSDRSTYFSVCLPYDRLLEHRWILPFWRGYPAVAF